MAPACRGQQRGARATGSSVSAHGRSAISPPVLRDSGGLERRDHKHGLAVDGEHEKREPLQRHGPIAGQPGQVGAVRQEQRVDPEVAMRARGPLAPGRLRVMPGCRGRGPAWRSCHGGQQP